VFTRDPLQGLWPTHNCGCCGTLNTTLHGEYGRQTQTDVTERISTAALVGGKNYTITSCHMCLTPGAVDIL